MENYKINVKYPKSKLDDISQWWVSHQEYDINEYEDFVEIVLRQNWEQEQIQRLRTERERICFPIINRGQLWYNQLTEEQKNELETWYKAWLDVTKTYIKPKAPNWI